MNRLFNHPAILALATLVGTIVGAGIFGLPYAISQSGLALGLFYFILVGGLVLLLHLFFGEFALRTTAKHRLPGYAGMYLGKPAKYLATGAIFFSVAGSLLAYTIIGGEFIHQVFRPWFDFPASLASVLFWLFLSFFIFRGIRLIARAELFMVLALFATIGLITIFAWPHIDSNNFQVLGDLRLLGPYGVILFALTGWSAIPEIADLFKTKKDRGRLDNIIFWASVLTLGLYLAFTLAVVGVSGALTSEDALTGLTGSLGEPVVALGALFGLLAVAASFLVLGNYLKNSLRYDFDLPYFTSASLATLIPLGLYFLGIRSFIAVIDIVGVLSLGAIEGVLIILIYRRAKKSGDRQPEYHLKVPDLILWLMAGLLILGALAKVLTI